MHPWPDLRAILRGLRWVIIGGVATRAYMPERMTKDLDILVHHADAGEAIRRLQQNEFAIVSRLAVPGFLMCSATEVEVDVLIGQQPWLNKALAQVQLDPAGYPVLGLPYLVLMKLAAMRAQDWADISRMLGWATDDALNQVRAVVARYAPEDCDDLESLIFIGRKERELPPGD